MTIFSILFHDAVSNSSLESEPWYDFSTGCSSLSITAITISCRVWFAYWRWVKWKFNEKRVPSKVLVIVFIYGERRLLVNLKVFSSLSLELFKPSDNDKSHANVVHKRNDEPLEESDSIFLDSEVECRIIVRWYLSAGIRILHSSSCSSNIHSTTHYLALHNLPPSSGSHSQSQLPF